MLFELRIAVGRKHLAVGVDVHALAVGLLEKELEVSEVVAADDDERAFFDGERHLRGDGVAERCGICFILELHAAQVDFAGLEDERQQGICGKRLAESF